MTALPKGIIPPLTTPFTADGGVYEKGLRQLVDFQIGHGSTWACSCAGHMVPARL